MPAVLLSIGSNQGDRFKALMEVSGRLPEKAGPVTGYSSVFESEPWGFDADTDFLNQVLQIQTSLEPSELLAAIQEIETAMGRHRQPGGYQSRVIDIDILFYGDEVINDGDLLIPHPRLHLRKFVLQPLAELQPDFKHPLLGKSIRELLEECDDHTRVILYTEKTELTEYYRH